MSVDFVITPALTLVGGSVGVLATGLLLGVRHGFDWDHIAAITDITSTTSTADLGTGAHEAQHLAALHGHDHGHGGADELHAHDAGPGSATLALPGGTVAMDRRRFVAEQRHAIALGTLYAIGHAAVVLALGLAALAFGALLPDWVDPIMGRVVGLTLLLLGIWVFVSLYQFARHGAEFRLRSRWMIVFDSARYLWRRFQARLHGHEHVAPIEMSSYGPRTSLAVGMIHGIGAETGSQALLIASVGGAAGLGLGVPMLVAFIVGLLISNTAIILITATGFVTSQVRRPLYIAIGIAAGVFSIVVGTLFLFGSEGSLPDLQHLFGG
jgi:high-affinity nickel-transport protein